MLMLNPYVIILVLFVVSGVAATVWGWIILARGRQTMHWPRTTGTIEKSVAAGDLLPDIIFIYSVDGRVYRRAMAFSSGVTPTPELIASYVEKYSAGATVPVYYDSNNPERATLEPGPGRGDWMVFAIGLGMTGFGILFLLFGR